MTFSHKYQLLYRDRYMKAHLFARGDRSVFSELFTSRSGAIISPSVFNRKYCNTIEQVKLLLLRWDGDYFFNVRRFCVIIVVTERDDILLQV